MTLAEQLEALAAHHASKHAVACKVEAMVYETPQDESPSCTAVALRALAAMEPLITQAVKQDWSPDAGYSCVEMCALADAWSAHRAALVAAFGGEK